MMRILEEDIKRVAEAYDYIPFSFDEENVGDLVALEFEHRANTFLKRETRQVYPRFGGRISIVFRFVEKNYESAETDSHALDVWVAPVSGHGGKSFVICASMAVFNGLLQLFTSMVIGTQAVLNPNEVETLDDEKANEILERLQAALTFILLHEFAHILRLHIPFYFGEDHHNFNQSSGVRLNQLNVAPETHVDHIPLDKTRLHRAIEIDADQLALGIIHQYVSMGEYLVYENPNLDGAIFGEAVSVVMRIMEQWRRSISHSKYDPVHSDHPHPDIRYIFIYGWLMARKKEMDREKPFIDTALEFDKGFEKAMKIMNEFGNEFFPLFEFLEAEGSDKSLEEYEILRIDLEKYLKPRLAEFKLGS